MMADQVPDVPRKAARKQAMATLATMMGTLVLSRIAGSGEFSDEILGAGREAVLGRGAGKPAAKKASREAELAARTLAQDFHTVSSVQPSSRNSAARSGASSIAKNSSSCGGLMLVSASMAWAWPR